MSRARSPTPTDKAIVHRDIKPENILLQDNHTLVADFGIGKAISEAGEDIVTQTGHERWALLRMSVPNKQSAKR